MNWAISADGTSEPGMGAATDADEDMAFALADGRQAVGRRYAQTT